MGFNGGISRQSTLVSKPNKYVNFHGENTHAVFNIKGMYNIKKWQFGASLGMSTLSGKYHRENFFVILHFPYTTPLEEVNEAYDRHINPRYNIQYIPINLIANRTLQLKKLRLHGGISVGYLQSARRATESDLIGDKNTIEGYPINYSAGVQCGATYNVTNHIGINAEAGANYMRWANEFNIYTLPITAGVVYRF